MTYRPIIETLNLYQLTITIAGLTIVATNWELESEQDLQAL